MKLFGFEIGKSKSFGPVDPGRGWRDIIREPFTGAWQRNMEEKREDVYCYPALYACLRAISTDIGKLPFQLKFRDENRIWRPAYSEKHSPVLRKPNYYQTSQQFREAWMLSKLQHGNAYILKERDRDGNVSSMYVLDPCRVLPMVSDSGAVYYQLQTDLLSGMRDSGVIVPASEIIHDRFMTLHHHLIGVPPVCAAFWPAVKNLKILRSSADFFANNARPSGILIAPAGISDEDAMSVLTIWNSTYGPGGNGKTGLLAADMKYQELSMSSADSQLVEQMRYSDEQICQPFGIPPFKIGIGSIPAGMKVDDINQLYYSDALQTHIEAMENLLDEGMRVEFPMGIELDIEPLIRMDEQKRAAVWSSLKGIATPNEARFQFSLAPLEGGDTVYMQQQDIPLEEARKNVVEAPEPEPAPAQAVDNSAQEQERAMIATINKAFDMVTNGTA